MIVSCVKIVSLFSHILLFMISAEFSTGNGTISPIHRASYASTKVRRKPSRPYKKVSKFLPNSSSIIDGDLAAPDEFKYIVSISEIIRDDRGEYPKPIGAGIILDEKWVLTARHNILKEYLDEETPYFNFSYQRSLIVQPKYDNNLINSRDKPVYWAAKTFCHPPSSVYPILHNDNDIALMKFPSSIIGFGSPHRFEKIALIDEDLDFTNPYEIRVAGWGQYYQNRPQMEAQLRKATLLSSGVRDLINNPGYRPKQQIAVWRERQGICFGDSGGPAVARNIDLGKDVLVGVITHGQGLMGDKLCLGYGYLQNVYYYRYWIDYVMKYESQSDRYLCKNLERTEYNKE